MKKWQQFYRLIHINYILAKNGLDEVIFGIRWFAPLQFLSYLNPWYWFRNRHYSLAIRLRLALEELGPIFVKFGQMLSTRQDFLPEEIVIELTKLQDKVLPFQGAAAIVEATFSKSINDIFISFEIQALASASIAQVHAAKLHDGTEVVVKVKRPGIEKIIRRDIALLYTIAQLAERYTLAGRRLRAVEFVKEFEHSILNELDLLREAANASILKRNFTGSDKLHVPEVHWEFCRENIMVMERIYGIPIADIEMLKSHNINLSKLVQNGVEIFFTQVFRDCFFHADMHPGNLFIDPSTPNNPKFIAVDFGIMGTLSATDQRYLAENLLAFFKRDYRRVAELHLESGWVPANTRIQEFEAAISTVCEPIFQRPLKDISFGQLLLRLFQTGKRFHMEIQPQLLLLQKTILHVEGMGRQLCPELDIWTSAQPILEDWMKRQLGPKAFWKKVKDNFPIWAEKLPEIPHLLYNYLQEKANTPETTPVLVSTTSKSRHPFWLGAGFASVLFSLVIVTLSHMQQLPSDLGYKLSAIIGGVGLISLLIGFLVGE